MGTDVSNGDSGSNGKRRRVSGRLDQGPRGLSILTETADIWVLVQNEIDSELLGRQVTSEGMLVGLDRLKVDWIGETKR